MSRKAKIEPAESPLPTRIRKLAELTDLVYGKEPSWKVKKMVLFPPAENHEIEGLSRECPVPLPAAYKEFLRVTNGCLSFWPQFALLGTKGEPRRIVQEKVEDAREFQSEYAAGGDGKVTPESLATFEAPAESGQEFFLPNHLVFGTDCGGEFFLFNETKKTAAGEYEAVHYTLDGGAYYRYPDFNAFLEATIAQLQARIKEKGYGK